MKVFSVAAKTFDVYSETFIRYHAENILPGATALVALKPVAVFLPQIDSDDCFAFCRKKPLLPKKIDRMLRFVAGGSIYYPGNNASNLLADFLRKRGVKVLLAEYGPVGCAVERACRMAGVKLYVHFHGYDASRLFNRRYVRHSYRWLFESAKGFIFPSNFLAQQLCDNTGIPRNDRIHVVPCCVQPDEFCAMQPKDNKLLLSVGRFVPKKGPQETILAFSKLLQNLPGLRLEMIGDGKLLPICKELVQTLDIKDHVVFHGSKPHDFVKEKMKRATLFLQHSVTAPDGDMEGLPVALLEAMASGAVVVSTKHSGIVEAVINGKTGFLVEEHDVEDMADKCLRLLRDMNMINAMRASARNRIEEFYSVDKQVSSLKKIMGL
jgi:glycosyltransferase involved in cell wall biosynthesis